MAEFSRKSRSKRILENINTAQATKKQVYDFYQRWRKQYGEKGKGLDFAKSKKADIVRELHQLEAKQHVEIQPERRFERRYEQVKKKIKTPGKDALEALKKLQAQAEKLVKAGKISEQKANLLKVTAEPPKPRKKSTRPVRQQRKNVYYKGRYAHDYIKKMVDDSLLDTDTFDDSQEIWYAIDILTGNSEEFDFFEQHYSGQAKKGSRDYYLGTGSYDLENAGFEDFLQITRDFEEDLQAKGQTVPERLTEEYWLALKEWLKNRGGTSL